MNQQRADELASQLTQRFDAQVDHEAVSANGRYRFVVVSPKFEPMSQLSRQDAVWDVVDELLSREESLDISLIITYAPNDMVVAD